MLRASVSREREDQVAKELVRYKVEEIEILEKNKKDRVENSKQDMELFLQAS